MFLREAFCLTGVPSYIISNRVSVESFKVLWVYHPLIRDETEHMKRSLIVPKHRLMRLLPFLHKAMPSMHPQSISPCKVIPDFTPFTSAHHKVPP